MRYWMSADAEKTRMEPSLHARRQGLPGSPAVRRLLVSAREVALRADAHSPVGPGLRTSNHITAMSLAHAGPRRAGVARRDRAGHPDLPAVRSERGRAVGKSILHPAGPQASGRPGRPPPTAAVALLRSAAPAVCSCEPAVPRPGRDEGSPASGVGVTATTGRDADGGRGHCRGAPDHSLTDPIS
jgi:hypothetical protein